MIDFSDTRYGAGARCPPVAQMTDSEIAHEMRSIESQLATLDYLVDAVRERSRYRRRKTTLEAPARPEVPLEDAEFFGLEEMLIGLGDFDRGEGS